MSFDGRLVASALTFKHRGCWGRMVLERVLSRAEQHVGVFCCYACGDCVVVDTSGRVVLKVAG